jgi:hypothetical protein
VSTDPLAADLAPLGTEDYYIARLHPPRERLRVALHLALETRLLGLLREGRDRDAVGLRLRWWQDCLAAAAAGDFRHPLTARLGALDPDRPTAWPAAFADAARGLELRLDWQTPPSAAEALDNLRRVEGALALALARDLLRAEPEPPALEAVAELAALTAWARGLQWLPHWQRLGLNWIPRETLAAHADRHGRGPGGDAPGQSEGSDHWPRLAGDFIGQTLGQALAAHRRLPRAARAATLCVRIRHACGRAELAHAAAAGWPVLAERVTLTPIARLLIALGVKFLDRLPRGPVTAVPGRGKGSGR